MGMKVSMDSTSSIEKLRDYRKRTQEAREKQEDYLEKVREDKVREVDRSDNTESINKVEHDPLDPFDTPPYIVEFSKEGLRLAKQFMEARRAKDNM